jgi:hypothetical protein
MLVATKTNHKNPIVHFAASSRVAPHAIECQSFVIKLSFLCRELEAMCKTSPHESPEKLNFENEEEHAIGKSLVIITCLSAST